MAVSQAVWPKSSNQSKILPPKPPPTQHTEKAVGTSTHVPGKDRTVIHVAAEARTAVDVGVKVERGTAMAASVKNGRQRTLSASSSNAVPTRKRTSSGVFQVDESEPTIKKTSNSLTTESPPTQTVGNGVRKSSGTLGEQKEKNIADRVIETFVGVSSKSTVSAFKEDDSWE